MSNPLFNAMGNKGPTNNFAQMMQSFQQFKNSFSGDPKQQVQQLLNSGKMTQAQYNQLSSMANQFMQMFK